MNLQEEFIRCLSDKTRKYFIEHYLSTFNADERKEVPFRLFPRQIELLKSFVNNSNTITVKHRQAGITTVASAWVTGQCVFASKQSPETVLCIGNKLDISEQLVEKISAFLDQVPRWFWGNDFYSPDPKSPKNKKSIYKTKNKQHIELFNGCKIYARSSGENAARGISAVSILIFDEAAFIQNGISVYAQAVAATASVKDAKILMISTPNGKDQLYYRTYSKALKKENNYSAVEFKWFQDLRYNRHLKWYRKNKDTGEIEWDIDTVLDKYGNIEYNEERWRNLERDGWTPTSPWFEDMCKSFNNDEQKIAQELQISFLGSSDNVVSPEVIEMQMNSNVIKLPDDWYLGDPFVKETWIWKDPIPGHRYICSVDASSGSADDYTAIEIIDVDAIGEDGLPCFEQVLEYYGKKTGDEIGEMVFQYASSYNNALAIVDCIGGYGDATVLTLQRLGYPNLYHEQPQLKSYTIERAYSKFNLKPGDQLPGFRNPSLRTQMIQNFVAMVKDNSFRIRSIRVINELETWIFKNGRPDHMEGCHDDSLTCLSMGLFVMQYFMLKNERDKSKDTSIIKSWVINNSANNNRITRKLNDHVTISLNRKLPFYSTQQIEKMEKQRVNAMILLGGFKTKR